MAFTLTINTVAGDGWPPPTPWLNVWNQAISDLQTALVPKTANVTVAVTGNWNTSVGLGGSNCDRTFSNWAGVRSAYLALTPGNSIQTASYTGGVFPSSPPTADLTGSHLGSQALSISIGLDTSTTSTNGTATFNSGATWDTSSLRGDSVSGSGFTAYGTIMHELTEILGRFGYQDTFSSNFTCCDAWSFNSTLSHDTTSADFRYISSDGGTTNIGTLSTRLDGDVTDLASGGVSAFLAFTAPQNIPSRSSTLPLLATDWQWMTVLGWDLSATGMGWAGLGGLTQIVGSSVGSAAVNGVMRGMASGVGSSTGLATVTGASNSSYILTHGLPGQLIGRF